MTFLIRELSNYLGKPTLLYDFTRDTKTWRYTSADRDIILGANTYTALPIKCSEINQTGDSQSDEVTITMPAAEEMPSLFVSVPPVDRVKVTVRRYHKDDADSAIRYVGYVDRVKRITPLKAELKCKTLDATLRRAGARLMWQRTCPHALYSRPCGVNRASYAVAATATAVSGVNLSATALGSSVDGHFYGGYIEWATAPDIRMWRAITGHAGNTVSLLGGTFGLEVGDTFTAYPGCARNAETCNDKFNNLPNFGGIRHLPQRSPFDGNPVF
jgi:uncharacterized phage protein (TIGR02218 family)